MLRSTADGCAEIQSSFNTRQKCARTLYRLLRCSERQTCRPSSRGACSIGALVVRIATRRIPERRSSIILTSTRRRSAHRCGKVKIKITAITTTVASHRSNIRASSETSARSCILQAPPSPRNITTAMVTIITEERVQDRLRRRMR